MRPLTRLESRLPGGLSLALVLLVGLAVFFRAYGLGGRDLWTDEAWVALAVLEPSPAAALAAGQSTPPFYLLTLWAAARLLGGSEAVLRSLSFLFGLGTVLLFWPLARTLTSLSASLLGLATVACSPILVYYAKELKQYSGDAFFAVLVFFLVERLRACRGTGGWPALAVAGILGLGFSHTLIFILPVAVALLGLALPLRRPRVAALAFVWALAFAAYYTLFFRHQVNTDLVAYWAQDFPDLSGFWPFCLWCGQALDRYFWYFLGEWGLYLGLPLLLAGAVALVRQGSGRALLYLGGPLLLAFGAAVLHRYPFMAHFGGNRLMLFSAPLFFLVVAAGLTWVLTWLWQRRRRTLALALAALILLALNPPKILQENLNPSNNREEIRPLVAHLKGALEPQDWVYVYYFAISPFKYYFPGTLDRISWGKSCVETDLTLPTAGAPPPRRLWLIASHIPSLEYMRPFAANLLGPHWQETVCLTREGAVLFRFEAQGPVVATKTPAPPPGPGGSGAPAPPADKACK